MAELEWSLPKEGQASPAVLALLGRLFGRFLDWEDWLTLLLTLAAALCVSAALEGGGWSEDMPPITLVSVIAVGGAFLIAQTRLTAWLAWPMAVLLGALVTFWQTLEMVGPGNLEQRVDAIYVRFSDWYHLATTGGISFDSLPRDVLTLGLTWLGVFLFGWSVYRWHNAWIGLIPGGIALFVDLVFIGDDLSGIVLLYLLFGFLLVMRTNLMARMARWRSEETSYPPMISLTSLNFSAWALIGLLTAAWIAPVGPFSTPPLVEAVSRGVEEIGLNFVRLAGPLEVKKVVPVHNYTGVLPFQGSVKLGDREVLSVRVSDVSVEGPIPLRGAVYDVYTSGGWKAGERRDYDPPASQEWLEAALEDGSVAGGIVPLSITVERKSVVGTVLFSPGEPLAASVHFDIEVPAAAVSNASLRLRDDGIGLSNLEVLTDAVPDLLGEDVRGLKVERDGEGRVKSVDVLYLAGAALPDVLVAKPHKRLAEGTSYTISGFLPGVTPEELSREAVAPYPSWVIRQYLQLPDTLSARVRTLAHDVAGFAEVETPVYRTGTYAAAKAIEDYLRAYPLDYRVSAAPPGADGVDHFLFESRRGYFDYHASAMVVMLRALGIPARLAVGYVIDESDFDAEREAYSVRDRNSYSWAEVYFPDYGWIAFNPSPDRAAELAPTVVQNAAPGDGSLPVVDGPPVLPLNEDPIDDILREPGADSGQFPATGRDKYNPLITAAVFGFVAMVAGAVALGWQRSVRGLPYSQQLWEKTVRLATWAGHPPQPGQTPTEFGRHLERTFYGARGFSLLASIYSRSRFGRRDEEGEEREQLREVWPHLRGDLLTAIPRRFLKRRR
jgi:transglutaminase-like putative cysteine protease